MENDAKLTEKEMYDKAIEGYKFQVERYNTWMNYYALFVGALFVALYYLVAYGKDPKTHCAIYILITALGIFASICWLASLIGFDTWIKHWLSLVKEMENEALPINKKIYQLTSVNDKNKGTKYLPGYISTQKITQWFVAAVLYAWMLVGLFLWKGCICCCGAVVELAVTAALWALFRFVPLACWSSNLKDKTNGSTL